MPRGKAEQAEVIIPKLREVEVELGRGKTVAEAVKKIGVTEQTYSLEKRSSVVWTSKGDADLFCPVHSLPPRDWMQET